MTIETDDEGGRVFFSSAGRSLEGEDEICLLSVGVDIGSATSHLVFSRIVVERLDSRYVVTERDTFYQSDILLTPYAAGDDIDADALGAFFEKQYENALVDPDEIDAGALILTGVAVRRANARRIGELFARQAGRLVAVSAGDALETVMAAYGSGAVARSIRDGAAVMNVDVGGGTAKIAVCRDGAVTAITAVDVGARLVCTDAQGRITRLEEAGRLIGADLGLCLDIGARLAPGDAERLAARMADALFEAIAGGAPRVGTTGLLRLDPLILAGPPATVTFSGGVSEYVYGWENGEFGDLGRFLAAEIGRRSAATGMQIAPPAQGIRATVIGASQYTTQVSGSTIFVSPLDVLPLRNLPVIAPAFALKEDIDSAAVAGAIRVALQHFDLTDSQLPVAIFVSWTGSATFHRLDAFCRGVADGLGGLFNRGLPIVLAGDGDVGGLLGIHFREEMKLINPVISIDGLELKPFDFIDIGQMLESSGAVPVVIKSLIFPHSAAPGQAPLRPAPLGEAAVGEARPWPGAQRDSNNDR
jgi:ethanolamine utilization protein EutA